MVHEKDTDFITPGFDLAGLGPEAVSAGDAFLLAGAAPEPGSRVGGPSHQNVYSSNAEGRTGRILEFIYVGGSKPGSPRTVNVSLVFQHEPEGRIYVSGYCRERAANRVFALDLIMVIHAWN